MPPSIQNPPRKHPLPPLVLWVGVLLADWCIMAPVLLIGAMMSSGWVGGSSHPENFWHIVIPSLGVLAILSALALFAWRHVRWLVLLGCACLAGNCLLVECCGIVQRVVASYGRMRHWFRSRRDRAVSLSAFGGTSRRPKSARILRGTCGISQADRHKRRPIDDRLYAVAKPTREPTRGLSPMACPVWPARLHCGTLRNEIHPSPGR